MNNDTQSNVTHPTSAVDSDQQQHPAFSELRMVPLLIRRAGNDGCWSDELFFAPVCGACGEVITKFDEANLVTTYSESESQGDPAIPLGTRDGASLFRLPGTATVLHKSCDVGRTYPWKPLNTILKSDQRYDFEKPQPKPRTRSRGVGS